MSTFTSSPHHNVARYISFFKSSSLKIVTLLPRPAEHFPRNLLRISSFKKFSYFIYVIRYAIFYAQYVVKDTSTAMTITCKYNTQNPERKKFSKRRLLGVRSWCSRQADNEHAALLKVLYTFTSQCVNASR